MVLACAVRLRPPCSWCVALPFNPSPQPPAIPLSHSDLYLNPGLNTPLAGHTHLDNLATSATLPHTGLVRTVRVHRI